jgi:hypothetical protein
MQRCFSSPERNYCQHRLLYLAKLSFIIEGQIKTFCDKQKHKTKLKIFKGILHAKGDRVKGS